MWERVMGNKLDLWLICMHPEESGLCPIYYSNNENTNLRKG